MLRLGDFSFELGDFVVPAYCTTINPFFSQDTQSVGIIVKMFHQKNVHGVFETHYHILTLYTNPYGHPYRPARSNVERKIYKHSHVQSGPILRAFISDPTKQKGTTLLKHALHQNFEYCVRSDSDAFIKVHSMEEVFSKTSLDLKHETSYRMFDEFNQRMQTSLAGLFRLRIERGFTIPRKPELLL